MQNKVIYLLFMNISFVNLIKLFKCAKFFVLKLAQIEQIPDKKFNVPSVSIEEIKIKQASSSANVSMVSNLTESVGVVDSNIKRQYVIENVGHFKYLRNNNIVIYFIDKVKLHMDEYSLKKYLENDLDKCSCCVFLPDSSQHDVQLRFV